MEKASSSHCRHQRTDPKTAKVILMKTFLLTGILLASSIPLGLALRPAQQPTLSASCANVLPHEPVAVFEVRGATLSSRIDRTLTVYSDGSTTLSEINSQIPNGKCDATSVTTARVRQLVSELRQGGAAVLCDDTRDVTDVPLRTLTFLGGTQDARAHSFSYWIGDGEYSTVDVVLEKFIIENFSDS
ncbi:MAG TPA: hypothetical protein VM509_04675 [Planctomycetota bacterium]|nr:hypothetical protein [Planctomycetota bacterium]